METFGNLMQGFAIALTPLNLLWALAGVTVGTAIGVLPGLGPALTIALLLPITYKVDPTFDLHPVLRHLLRRHVRRIDHVDPDQYAGRKRFHRHSDRRQQDGPQRPRRRGSGDSGDRLVRGRHHRHHRHHVPGRAGGEPGAQVRSCRVLLADGAVLRYRVRGARLLDAAGFDGVGARPVLRPDRRRSAERPAAFPLRRHRAARRHLRADRRGRPVRRRRDALPGGA